MKETTLEGKILNQLIHQIPVDRIPQTNFRVKKDVGRRNIIIITILLWIFDYYKKSDDEGYVVVKNPIKDKRY